jgi:hypothetical protein
MLRAVCKRLQRSRGRLACTKNTKTTSRRGITMMRRQRALMSKQKTSSSSLYRVQKRFLNLHEYQSKGTHTRTHMH